MKKTMLVLLLFAVLQSVGCLPTTNIGVPGVYSIKPDEFNPGKQKYVSSNFNIKGIEFGNPGFSTLGELVVVVSESGTLRYVQTFYTGKSWLFVDKIKFLIDGEIFEYDSEPNTIREVASRGYVDEINKFIVPEELFFKLFSANKVVVRLTGSNYYVGKSIDIKELSLLQSFIRYTCNY